MTIPKASMSIYCFKYSKNPTIKYQKNEMIKIKNDILPRMELNRVPSVDFGVSVDSPDYFQR